MRYAGTIADSNAHILVAMKIGATVTLLLPGARVDTDAQMGGPAWTQKGSATESKPQWAAPQAGRPTHEARQHDLEVNTTGDPSCGPSLPLPPVTR